MAFSAFGGGDPYILNIDEMGAGRNANRCDDGRQCVRRRRPRPGSDADISIPMPRHTKAALKAGMLPYSSVASKMAASSRKERR